MNKTEKIFNKIVLMTIIILGGITFAISCITMVQTSSLMQKQLGTFWSKGFVLAVGVMIIGGVSFLLNKWLAGASKQVAYTVALLAAVSIVALQIIYILFISKAYPKTDNYTVLTTAMRMAREGKLLIPNGDGYFGAYPNNLFIVFFLYGFFRIMLFFHIEQLWNAAIVLNVVMIDLAIMITFFTVKKMRGLSQATMIMILIAMCPTTYQWLTFTYTNTLSLVFCMGLLYMVISYPASKSMRIQVIYMLILGAVAAVGYSLRATIIIPVIASAIYLLFKLYHSRKDGEKKRITAGKLGAFLICFLICCKVITACQTPYLEDHTKAKRYPIEHWIMLGLSESGGYSAKDSQFTKSHSSYEAKKEADRKEIIKRLSKRDPFKLMKIKLKRVWANGEDESFSFNQKDTKEHTLHKYVNGNRNFLFAIYSQAYRVLTLLLIVVGAISLLKGKRKEDEFLYVLTLLGAILFFLIWEANTKYNISFILVMLVAMSYGLESTAEYIGQSNSETKRNIYKMSCVTSLALVVLNTALVIYKQPVFIEKKYKYENYVLNGKRKIEASFKVDPLNGKKLTQTFQTKNGFNQIMIMAKQIKKADTVYTIRLLDEEGKEQIKNDFTTKNVKSDHTLTFKCNIKKQKETKEYRMEITKKTGVEDSLIFAQMFAKEFDYIPNGILTVGESPSSNDLYLDVKEELKEAYTSRLGYWIIAGSILVLQISLCVVCISLFKATENASKNENPT